jgi:c-di-GMP-binding flagellar brake protein YcgR
MDCPVELQAEDVAPVIGQLIGVTFRSGHRKFAFESELIARAPARDGGGEMLTLNQPQEIQVWQRRLYNRTRVPDDVTIPINVTLQETAGAARDWSVPRRGILLDLSAGGMSLALSADRGRRWRCGDMMTCLVALEPAREPREVTGCLRHVEQAEHGRLRLGVQFVGLETSPAGQETLRQISRVNSRFRHAASRRAGRL